MEPRTELFSDRVQYFLDCAQEGWELDSGSALTLELYGDEAKIAEIINADGPLFPGVRSHYKNNRAKCVQLAAMADAIMPQLPELKRAGIARHGLVYLNHGVTELAETMSYWTIEDEIDGGCMEKYRKRPRSRGGITNKNTLRRLLAPSFIRRYVKLNAAEHADHLYVLNEIVLRRARNTTPQKDPELMALYRAQIQAAHPRHDRMMATAFPELTNRLQLPTPRDQRKVIKRSLNMAMSLLGEETVRSFLRGESIRLLGTDTMLILRKRGRLAACGHGNISIAIADSAGTTLADLCTYIENTPTLDQLCGFALWMNAGEERKIMETANIIKLAEGAKDHPVISHHYEQRRVELEREYPQIAELIAGNRRPVVYQLTHEQKRERAQQYWELTKGEWLEAMVVAVIGYRNLPVYKLAGAL